MKSAMRRRMADEKTEVGEVKKLVVREEEAILEDTSRHMSMLKDWCY